MMFKRKINILLAIVCFLLSFAIMLQLKSVTRNDSIEHDDDKLIEEADTRLMNANQQIIDLQKENMQLTSDIEIYRREMASNSDGAEALKSELEKHRTLSGFTNVEGDGVVIEVADSTLESEGYTNDELIVHDSDLRTIVNELFGAGAEAVSINEERIIINTPIRCVGNTIMVNNKRCSSPYVIRAIGDADTMETALKIRGGIVDELIDSTISVNITKNAKVKIGKYMGTVELYYATDSEK